MARNLKGLPAQAAGAEGLEPDDRAVVEELVRVWQAHRARNELRDDYYLEHVGVKDIGVAIPKSLSKRIDPRCDWPRKAVLALANRSQFDGFAASDDAIAEELQEISEANGLKLVYRRAVVPELTHCMSAMAVTAGEANGSGGYRPLIHSYPATAMSMTWDQSLKAVEAGLVVVGSRLMRDGRTRVPTALRVFTKGSVIELLYEGGLWAAEYKKHSMGRPLIVPLANEPTDLRPFGRSRITRSMMGIADDAIREEARAEVAAEFAALPQKYVVGTYSMTTGTDEKKYNAAMGVIMEFTKDQEGDRPDVGQFPQISMQPHIDYMRFLASKFAGYANIPVSSLGVVTDNPTSAEAIYAAKEDLVIDAQNLNASNGQALRDVALMALAVSHGTSYAEELARGVAIHARFRNPAMPSVVSQSDAMVKQISAIDWLAETDVALEELGYTEEQVQRMKPVRRRAQARAAMAPASSRMTGAPDA